MLPIKIMLLSSIWGGSTAAPGPSIYRRLITVYTLSNLNTPQA